MNKASNGDARRAIRVSAMIYGAAWFACLALYWGSLLTGNLGGGAIMGYSLLVLYIVLPLAGAVASFLVGRVRTLERWRFIAPPASAALYLIFIGVTFDLSTALGLTNIASAAAPLVAFVFACAFLGLAIGMVAATRAQRKP